MKECLCSFDSATQVVTIVMLAYMIYLTIIFAISYFKRLMWICILIVIAPIVSIMYAFGNQTKQIYSKWLREYIMMVLIQPFHIIVYYTLVSVPLNMLGAGTFEYTAMSTFTEIYALAAISMIKPAERYIMSLFGFNQGLAKMASADEGKKTLNNTIKIVGTMATGAATAGLGAAAMSALKGGQLISSFSKATKTALGNGKVGQFLGKGVDKAAEGATRINDKIFKNNQKSDAIDSGVATSRYPRQIPDKVEETPKENRTENQNEENNLLSSEINNTSQEQNLQKQTMNTEDTTQQEMVGNNDENVQEGIRLIESNDEQSDAVENESNNDFETKNNSQENNDKNNIVNASNKTVNAGTVNMQGENTNGIRNEIQQNDQGIKTVDTQEDKQENDDSKQNVETSIDTNTTTNENTEEVSDKNINTQENSKGQNNINANNIIINAGNVNMQTQNGDRAQDSIKQKATDDEESEDTEGEDVAKEKNGESTDKDKNNDDLVLHGGEDEKKKKSLKDIAIGAIEGGNDKTLNIMKLATGQQGVFETLDNINPNSRLGKATSELLDNDFGNALKRFEQNLDFSKLHENYNELRDSFDPNANGDWKPTNERLQANQKEKIEDRKYTFVHNEGNKNIMFNIMKEKYFEKLKNENPTKNDAWAEAKCRELAKSELKSLSEVYAPLGVLDAQMAYDCEEDRQKYGIGVQEAVSQRREFEMKLNQNSNVLIKLDNAVGGKPNTVTEKIEDARTYWQEGYKDVNEMAWLDKMQHALQKDPVYVMQVDKELKKKGGQIEYKGKDPNMADTIKQINEHYKKTGSV